MNLENIYNNITIETLIEQKHPYSPYVPLKTKTLILGSFPPYRFCIPSDEPLLVRDIQYYYGSYGNGYNMFWDVMFNLFNSTNLQEIRKKEKDSYITDFQTFLTHNNLGIIDIFLRVLRKGTSSDDKDLFPKEFRSIKDHIKRCSDLSIICCTSKQVYFWFIEYLIKKCDDYRLHISCREKLLYKSDNEQFEINEEPITIKILPSTSPRVIKKGETREDCISRLSKDFEKSFCSEKGKEI